MTLIKRLLEDEIQRIHSLPRGRLLVLTGARQCGKTTLAKMAFPDYPIISLDSPVERSLYEKMRPADWIAQYPRAVIDEAQKLPAIFETIKACYDRDPDVRYILLGSSQILLLKNIRESLAGRVSIHELYPFALPELMSAFGTTPVSPSRLITLLQSTNPAGIMPSLFPPSLPLESQDTHALRAWEYFLHWGGLPAILGEEWTDEDRFEWLADYFETYLQRDLADLAKLDRLEPFVRAQKASALKTAQLINFSELARLSEVSSPTAKQFMRYLEISYQILLLPPWFRNPQKRLSKQRKLHFLDMGIRRSILKRRGAIDGAEFESAVTAEIWKQCRTARVPVELHHLRTADGREIDLLLEREDGFIAIKIKQASKASTSDFRHLRNLNSILDKPLLLALVVSNDIEPRAVALENTKAWCVAAHQLFSYIDAHN